MKTDFIKALIKSTLYMLGGLLVVAIGVYTVYHQRALEKQGLEAPGTVIEIREHYDSDGSAYYTPVVQYKTNDGQTIKLNFSYASSRPEYEIGDAVTVVYLADNPRKAVIKGQEQTFSIIPMIFGGIIAAFGAYLVSQVLRFRHRY